MYKDKDGTIWASEEEWEIVQEIVETNVKHAIEEYNKKLLDTLPEMLKDAILKRVRQRPRQKQKIRFELEYDRLKQEFSVVTPIRKKEVTKWKEEGLQFRNTFQREKLSGMDT